MVFQNHLHYSVGREGEGVFPTPWQSKLFHIADFTIWESDEIMICICIANWDPFPFWGFNSIQVIFETYVGWNKSRADYISLEKGRINKASLMRNDDLCTD